MTSSSTPVPGSEPRRSPASPRDAAGVVIGDLSSAAETRALADQVNDIGRMDAVIHNAGVFLEPSRSTTPDGHAKTLAVNTLAPYMLTALINRPDRLIYLSSGMHLGASGSLRDIDWAERPLERHAGIQREQAPCHRARADPRACLAEVLSNAVDPGWVPTKMGGPGAMDDLRDGIPHADLARRQQ